MTDFRTFLASLAATTAATLHHVEQLLAEQTAKPETGEQIRTALATSQQLIDTLVMLEQKTRGNLTTDESQFLQSALAELRISYVRVLDRSRFAAKT